jgi:hypothetical protein
MLKKILLASSLISLSGIAVADDYPCTLCQWYAGGSISYNHRSDALPNANRDAQNIGAGAVMGWKQTFANMTRIFYGFEFQVTSLGSDSWTGSPKPSANYYQANILYVLHLMPYRLVDLKLKAGAAWQFNQVNNIGSNTNWFALPVIGAGVGVYVAPRIETSLNWLYTFGDGDGKALRSNQNPVANSQYSLSVTYHW